MADLNYLRIAQMLGGTISEIPGGAPSFGSIAAVQTSAERFRSVLGSHQEHQITPDQHSLVAKAFEKVRNGYEVDRVLVDPVLSKAFIAECHRLGITAHTAEINKRLQSFRKASGYGIKLKRTTRAHGLEPEPFSYAAELGYTQFSYRSKASIDDIITDPKEGELFAHLCKQIAPSGNAMIFKWAVIALRKMRSFTKLKSKRLLAVDAAKIEKQLRPIGTLDRIAMTNIPESQGVFSFHEHNGSAKYLYVGSDDNLRNAIAPFSRAQPFLALAGRFWTPSLSDISVSVGEFPKRWEHGSARDWALRLINVRRPLFNIPVDIRKETEEKK